MLDFKTIDKLKKDIDRYDLLKKNDKVLIAFSGGPDSVFLFHCLNFFRESLKLELELVYVNHKLRKDADEDVKFVLEFSKKYNVKYHIAEADIKETAAKKKISEEEAGREERYRIFFSIIKENNFDKIATGHNLDDNIETFIFRLLRGTALNGLRGIPVKRDRIIRPILGFRKEHILEILDNAGENYRIDSTNLEVKYTRNKIRNLIFPLFDEINPLFREKITGLIEEINSLENTEKSSEKILLLSDLEKMDKNLRNKKIFDLISMYDININREKIRQISDLINSNGNKEINLGNNFILYKNYDKLEVIFQNENILLPDELILEDEMSAEWGNYHIELTKKDIKEGIQEEGKVIFLEDNPQIKIRSRKEGDRIYLKNLGYKKIKKIFIDEKIEKKERDRIPVIELNNEIAALGDIKISGKLKPTKHPDKRTQMKLIIRRKNAK
jgi:tRNA(Ile)-lysidine synthase